MKFLNLVRYKNLLIIAASIYLMRHTIILPQLANAGIHSVVSEILFFFLTLSVLLIAAGGNIINDYFDIKADRINNPSKLILGKYISRRKGMLYHLLFTISGILIVFICSFLLKNILLILPYLLSAFLLWIYSAKYKRKALKGNIIIAFLSALAIYLPWFIETTSLHYVYQDTLITKTYITIIISCYAYFAFTSTMIREIIKDIEDIKGDALAGYATLPIKSGIEHAKKISLIFCLTIAIPLIYFCIRFLSLNFLAVFWYILLLILIPLTFIFYKIINSKNQTDISKISMFIKIFMLLGLSSAFLFL